jgi:hypothetical protein
MAEAESPQDLEYVLPTCFLIEPMCRLLQLVQERVVNELKDEVEVFTTTKDFNETHQVLVSEFLKSNRR